MRGGGGLRQKNARFEEREEKKKKKTRRDLFLSFLCFLVSLLLSPLSLLLSPLSLLLSPLSLSFSPIPFKKRKTLQKLTSTASLVIPSRYPIPPPGSLANTGPNETAACETPSQSCGLGESVAGLVTSTPPTMERRPCATARSTSTPQEARASRHRSALRTAATTVLRLSMLLMLDDNADCDSKRYLTICLPTLPEAPKTATASLRGGGGGGAEEAEEEEEEEEAEEEVGLDLLSPARAEATNAPRPTRT